MVLFWPWGLDLDIKNQKGTEFRPIFVLIFTATISAFLFNQFSPNRVFLHINKALQCDHSHTMLPKPRFFTLFSASDNFFIFNAILRKNDDLRMWRLHYYVNLRIIVWFYAIVYFIRFFTQKCRKSMIWNTSITLRLSTNSFFDAISRKWGHEEGRLAKAWWSDVRQTTFLMD